MRVYRVENANGRGPYMSGHDDSFVQAMNLTFDHGDYDHPAPWQDELFGYRIDSNEFCALDSPEALLIWFDGWENDLAADGFDVSVYEAPARVGEHGQALFVKDDATLIERISILAL